MTSADTRHLKFLLIDDEPDMVEAFPTLEDEFRESAGRFADNDQDIARKKDYLDAAGA